MNGNWIDRAANAVVSAVPKPALYNFCYHVIFSSRQSTINIPKPLPTAPAASTVGSIELGPPTLWAS